MLVAGAGRDLLISAVVLAGGAVGGYEVVGQHEHEPQSTVDLAAGHVIVAEDRLRDLAGADTCEGTVINWLIADEFSASMPVDTVRDGVDEACEVRSGHAELSQDIVEGLGTLAMARKEVLDAADHTTYDGTEKVTASVAGALGLAGSLAFIGYFFSKGKYY